MAMIQLLTKAREGGSAFFGLVQFEGRHSSSQWVIVLAGTGDGWSYCIIVRKPSNEPSSLLTLSSHLSCPSLEIPHRLAEKFICWVILYPVGLPVTINGHKFCETQGMSMSSAADLARRFLCDSNF